MVIDILLQVLLMSGVIFILWAAGLALAYMIKLIKGVWECFQSSSK